MTKTALEEATKYLDLLEADQAFADKMAVKMARECVTVLEREAKLLEKQKEVAILALEEIAQLHLGGIEFAQAAGWAAVKSTTSALEIIKKLETML